MPEKYSDAWRNQFASECFVGPADRDYLCARAAWRLGVAENFLWLGSQSLEKYLKAILLFNGCAAKGIGHNLAKALTRVRSIHLLPISWPDPVLRCIDHFHRHGQKRYLDIPFYCRGHELVDLDRTVWHLRRFCRPLGPPPPGVNKTTVEWMRILLGNAITPAGEQRPHTVRLSRGVLEDVLTGKQGRVARQTLVWNNVWFGARHKSKVSVGGLAKSAIPPHYRHPELFPELDKIVDFPKSVRVELAP